MIDDAELNLLAEDVKDNGLCDPIWTYEGKILDGRNRSAACLMACVEPEYREFRGSTNEAIAFVTSRNIHRRNLSASQRSAAALKLKDLVELELVAAKERQGARTDIPETFPECSPGDSRDKIGAMVGVSGRTISDAAAVKKEDPALFESVADGSISASKAKAKLKKRNGNGEVNIARRVSDVRAKLEHLVQEWPAGDLDLLVDMLGHFGRVAQRRSSSKAN